MAVNQIGAGSGVMNAQKTDARPNEVICQGVIAATA
jgi:hypothetical protein